MGEISQTVKDTVIMAHNRMGHPSRKTFLRMLRIGGSHPEAIKFAKNWTCPVCAEKLAPQKPVSVAGHLRPFGFNKTIHIDLKFMGDVANHTYAALSLVCTGTAYHKAVLLKTKTPRYVAKKILRHWISTFGAPLHLVHDQGPEFERDVVALLEDMSINTEVTGVQAPWQLAVGERHGGILGGLWRAVVHEHQCSDRESMKAALDAAVHAKNSTMTRNGFTPYQAVFGFHPRDPCSALQEDGQDNLPSADLGPDCEAGRAAAMRHTAKLAILRLDVKDKLRRAVTRQPPSKAHDYEFMPGTRVYFWDAHPGKGRYRDDPGRWKGPALILLREKGNRYFCSWHGRLMLLSGENLRPSSSEESAAFDMIAAEADAFGKEQQ